jgi:putative transposase
MRSHSELYVHLVWATWDRAPWVVPEARASVYRCIEEQALKYDSHVVAVGGVADHVHVVARFPARLSVSDLAKQLKGASSHHANDMRLARPFRWQGSTAHSPSRAAGWTPSAPTFTTRNATTRKAPPSACWR